MSLLVKEVYQSFGVRKSYRQGFGITQISIDLTNVLYSYYYCYTIYHDSIITTDPIKLFFA